MYFLQNLVVRCKTDPTQAVDGTTEYHMTQVNGWVLTGNPASFRQGAAAFRNARDWAQEQRDSFISATNKKARLKNVEPAYVTSNHNNIAETADTQNIAHTSDYTFTQANTHPQNTEAGDPVDGE
ncbi:hypothetical protein B0O99DRAFT_691945 [Bisporella sp. PMI_857]|nr:hypothetical protein B0O99DRAFT_691945 [Bisporella sp. PMI_857]